MQLEQGAPTVLARLAALHVAGRAKLVGVLWWEIEHASMHSPAMALLVGLPWYAFCSFLRLRFLSLIVCVPVVFVFVFVRSFVRAFVFFSCFSLACQRCAVFCLAGSRSATVTLVVCGRGGGTQRCVDRPTVPYNIVDLIP